MTQDEIERKLRELYSIIDVFGSKIDAPRDWLPAPKATQSHSWLQIEFREADDGDDKDGYWLFVESDCDGPWVCTAECFVEYSDSLLHELFEGITHNMAMAVVTPKSGEDARRHLFSVQESLLARVNPAWAGQTAKRHSQILAKSPFDDR